MSEAWAVPAVDSEEFAISEEAETRGNIRTKLITAGAAGAIGVGAYFAEKYGLVAGWPPPAHSWKHLAPGYWGALAASRLSRRKLAPVAAGAAANLTVESGQDFVGRADHYPLNWVHHAGEMDNVADFAVCMGGAALFLAQESQMLGRVRAKIAGLRPSEPVPSAAFDSEA